MKLRDYEFGFADATKEYTRKPEIFEKAFYDTRNTIERLTNNYQFLLIGRKGVGKSAFSSKIQSNADKSEGKIIAELMNLNDFEFASFAKTAVDAELSGTQKYKPSWDFVLLLSMYKIMTNKLGITENELMNEAVDLIKKAGFDFDEQYKSDIMRLNGIKFKGFGIDLSATFNDKYNLNPRNYAERLSILTDKMMLGIENVYIGEKKIVVIIDGLDDVLRYKKDKTEIIASLIRSVDNINEKMNQSKQDIKIVLLIREDIISMLNDPDLNKIIQDSAIWLSWSERLEELGEIIRLRFELSGLSKDESKRCWDNIFPKKIRGKSSWAYIMDYTLYKPRDILQFLKYCQTEYPDKESLTISELQKVLKIYSNKYFIEEMKNELSGFIDEELIYLIPSVFRRMGNRAFDIGEIERLFVEQTTKKITKETVKAILLHLFDAGYIGQLLPNPHGQKKRSVIFKHRNPTTRIDYNQKFMTHQGLHSGLGVRL